MLESGFWNAIYVAKNNFSFQNTTNAIATILDYNCDKEQIYLIKKYNCQLGSNLSTPPPPVPADHITK